MIGPSRLERSDAALPGTAERGVILTLGGGVFTLVRLIQIEADSVSDLTESKK